MTKPRFALVLPTRSLELTRTLAERAETAGFDAVAVEDHLFVQGAPGEDPRDPRLECFTALTAVAMVTRRVKLTQLVACHSFSLPAMTANSAPPTDHINGGRPSVGPRPGLFPAK